MAGPASQTAVRYVIEPGEAKRLYSPKGLAWSIENFRQHEDGYLASVNGPCPYEINRGQGYPVLNGRTHGLFHAGLLGGIGDTLLLRAGTILYRHQGWTRSYGALTGAGTINSVATTALTDERRPFWPDSFVTIGDKIIYTNGIDRALCISHDGMVVPLGFDTPPGAPIAQGPAQAGESGRNTQLPNSAGYSWPGRIGTVGDVLDGQTGSLLRGDWRYAARWEDVHGNLSAWSELSEVVHLYTQWAVVEADNTGVPPGVNPYVELDDLLRQFAVRVGGAAPDTHTVAMHLARTKDIMRNGEALHFLGRFGGRGRRLYPDKLSDAELGGLVKSYVNVPVFRVMAHHQGALLIGNSPNDPGIVRRSETGFPGTFSTDAWCYPDSGGAEVTGLASHADRALAFTETGVYDVTDIGSPVQLARGVGCDAPRSIGHLPDGRLVWKSRDGYYAMAQTGAIGPVSSEIHRTISSGLNRAHARRAVAAYDARSREYVCAVTPAGRDAQRLLLRFDGENWKEQDLGYDISDLCTTDDWRQLTLMAGRDLTNTIDGVWVLDHEVAAAVYTPPTRTYLYRSGWLRADEHALDPINIRAIYVGLVDGANANATVRLFRNGSWRVLETISTLRTVGLDDSSRVVTDIAGSAVLGTSLFHERRLFWRWIPCSPHLENVSTFAFEISSTDRINLAAFAFDISYATTGSPRGRVHRHDQT